MGKHWASEPHSDHVQAHLTSSPSLSLNRFHKSYLGLRAIHSRLVQVIIGHGFFGEYYSRFFPSEEVGCQCEGSPFQTLRHVLPDCPLHDVPRMKLRKASSTYYKKTFPARSKA
ncbi:hypothetical protein BDV93DRAFT_520349 [Ceratobasidium sp. AG-I]|nr:hypothetical protein BDV93DRAFT_520349 [Ceratobasidium sp. AG-I]